MTDREMLEWAARAAGMDYLFWTPGAAPLVPGKYRVLADRCCWHPLSDDGDALRLAVKLGLLFKPDFEQFLALERFAGQDRDDYSAVRRAIVRAAAEIGKAMP